LKQDPEIENEQTVLLKPQQSAVSPNSASPQEREWKGDEQGTSMLTPEASDRNSDLNIDRLATVSESNLMSGYDHISKSLAIPKPLQTLILIVSILTTVLAIRYIVWRCAVNDWHVWWFSAPLLIAEIFTAMHIIGYQYTIWPRRQPTTCKTEDISEIPIFIFIPTVNEGDAVLEPTLHGALAARESYEKQYPRSRVRIIVCNDGFVARAHESDETIELAKKMGVECITRQEPGGAKAGNIENARHQVGATGNSLIVVLDADQIPCPEFLLKTVPLFSDPTIGWVQTRQYYRNQNDRVAKWAEHQASLFYDIVCPGKTAVNAGFICGTNVVIRAEALDQIGGFPQDSITEDFAASIRAHKAWRSLYLPETLALGLGPMDLASYYTQQSRWARGTIGVLCSDWKSVFLPGHGGLNFHQRLQYFLSGTHYFFGLRDLTFLVCALLCLLDNQSPLKPVSLMTIVIYLLPYIISAQLLIFLQMRSRSMFTSMFIAYSSFPVLVASLWELLTNRRMSFKVTPKNATGHSDILAITPHLLLAAICIGAIAHIYSIHSHAVWTSAKAIPLFWVCYSLVMILPTFFLAKLTPQKAK
jgi:cellulose synthase (UDP-forming)